MLLNKYDISIIMNNSVINWKNLLKLMASTPKLIFIFFMSRKALPTARRSLKIMMMMTQHSLKLWHQHQLQNLKAMSSSQQNLQKSICLQFSTPLLATSGLHLQTSGDYPPHRTKEKELWRFKPNTSPKAEHIAAHRVIVESIFVRLTWQWGRARTVYRDDHGHYDEGDDVDIFMTNFHIQFNPNVSTRKTVLHQTLFLIKEGGDSII